MLFTREEKVFLWLLAAIQLVHIVDFMMLMPLGPMLSKHLHMNAQQFAHVVSAYSMMSGVSGVLGAFILNKVERKQTLLVVLCFFSLFTIATGLAQGYSSLLFSRAVAGFFGGLLGSMVQLMVAERIAFDKRGAAMGIVMSAFSVATVLGVPLALFVANHTYWRVPALGLGVVGLGMLLFAWQHLSEQHAPTQTTSSARLFVETLKKPSHGLAFLLTTLLAFSSFIIIPFITLFNVNNLQVPSHLIPYIYISGGIATWFSSRYIGQWADQYGKVNVLMVLMLLAIIPLWWFTHLQQAAFALLVCVTTLFFVLVSGRNIPAMAIVSEIPPGHLRGSFMSLHAAIQSFAMGLAALLGGSLIQFDAQGVITGFHHLGYAAVIFTFLAGVVLLWIARLLPNIR